MGGRTAKRPLLKDGLNRTCVLRLSRNLAAGQPAFDGPGFAAAATAGLEALELKARGKGSGAELALLSMLHILLNHGMVIQGNAYSAHYGPVALRESPQEEVETVCHAWGKHWAELVQRLNASGSA